MKKPAIKPRNERSPWKYFWNKKTVLYVYSVLRLLVIVTLVMELLDQDYEGVFICALTLILFVMPSILERRLRVDLPDTLEIILLIFIFSAQILGEIKRFYLIVPHWDTWLHTINGFIFAAIGFSVVNLLNEDKRISMTLSPLCMAVVAFCFSMTIGVLWEFLEWGIDVFLGFDSQKDTVLHTLSSVTLHPEKLNVPVVITDISDTILVLSDGTQVQLHVGGYLDMGLQDTMKDLLVNFIGAVVFSCIGYFYVKSKGEGKFAKMFIPTVLDETADE